jgi:mercuric ion transport protein
MRGPKTLAGMAGLACVACCLLPVLIAAGVVGTGASVVVGWLPALAIALAAAAAGVWWFGKRRPSCSCRASVAGDSGCGCGKAEGPLKIGGPAGGQGLGT